MTAETFDRMVNRNVLFLADSARKAGRVDTLARWTAVNDVVKSLLKKKLRPIKAKKLIPNELISGEWGVQPKIALVYGPGSCALSNGIHARWWEKVLKKKKKLWRFRNTKDSLNFICLICLLRVFPTAIISSENSLKWCRSFRGNSSS